MLNLVYSVHNYQPTVQWLTKSKLKGNMLNIYKCLPKDRYPNLWQKVAAVGASSCRSIYNCEQTFLLMKSNKSTQWNRLHSFQ
jgi:hypothetical protein